MLIRWGSKDYTTTDEKIQSDYIDIVVRKCIGYSAAFLDYFFRGRIEISLPETGAYAIIQDPDPSPGKGFSRISLLARNITDNGEEMSDGSIELVVKHKLALTDPFRNYDDLVPVTSEWLYIVIPEAKGVRDIPRNEAVKLDFDLEGNPIPLWATDVYLHDLKNIYLGFFPLSDCRYPSCKDEDFKIAYLGAGEYVRFFLLTDERYCMSHCAVSVVHTHPDDRFGFAFLGLKAWSFPGLKHQTDTETDPDVCGQYGLDAPCELRYVPYFISLKGVERWNRYIFENAPYPPGSSCSYDQLP